MAAYLAMRIQQGKLRYDEVVAKYPEFKEDIDHILEEAAKHKESEINLIAEYAQNSAIVLLRRFVILYNKKEEVRIYEAIYTNIGVE